MKRMILFVFLAISIVLSSAAQDQEEPSLKHEIGVAAGWSTGYGISYRYWPKDLGFQVTTTPHFEEGRAQASIGLTGLLKLSEIEWMRFFLYLGNHYMYETWEYTNHDSNGNPTDTYSEVQHRYVAGLGTGFEFLIGKKIGLNIMFGLRSDWQSPSTHIVGFSGETGLYYRF